MAGNRQVKVMRTRRPRLADQTGCRGLRRWREGKVRPIPGSSPHGQPVSRGFFSSLKESLRRSLPRHRIPHQSRIILGAQYAFSKAWRNLSGPMGFNFKNRSQNQILGRDHTASRWSAPVPGKRTRREEHALSHRPQMSSGRLFLDRVGRHQSPSPLRRHAQPTTHFPRGTPRPELSTLLGSGTFYFALTYGRSPTRPRDPWPAPVLSRVVPEWLEICRERLAN